MNCLPWDWPLELRWYGAGVSTVAHGYVTERACALILLAVMLGPGLLVNGVLKPLWGRPRPVQADLFGGSQPYQHWWQPGPIGGGKKLSLGACCHGLCLGAWTCLVPPRRSAWLRGLVLGGALAYGSLLGVTRIIQEGIFV